MQKLELLKKKLLALILVDYLQFFISINKMSISKRAKTFEEIVVNWLLRKLKNILN